jgi:glucan phosphoethanolaminetransferase (alkaline phosphatase superfamily)
MRRLALLSQSKPPVWSRLAQLPVPAKILVVSLFLLIANGDFVARAMDFYVSSLAKLSVYLLLWALAIASVFLACMQSSTAWRTFWSFVFALSTAFAFGHANLTQGSLQSGDVELYLANTQEVFRIASFYGETILPAVAFFVIGFLALAWPVRMPKAWQHRLSNLAWAPLVPITAFAALEVHEWGDSRGTYGMPTQIMPVSLLTVVAADVATRRVRPPRSEVTWVPAANERAKSIVVIMDESVGVQQLDFRPGNPYTPNLAAIAGRLANYGPTSAFSLCSNFSNAALRFAASRKDFKDSLQHSPYLFQYAKEAGYRTVYIYAQSFELAKRQKYQNHMHYDEARYIDGFYQTTATKSYDSDFELLRIIREELSSGEPVFIYANKNGAHIHYDFDYPPSAKRFGPTMLEAGDTEQSRLASYRNAIAWSVDKFIGELFKSPEILNANLVYTSDHGQRLQPGMLSHCVSDNETPEMGAVPLLAYSGDSSELQRLRKGASKSRLRSSSFQIAPTLLEWMGYNSRDIAAKYSESLTEGPSADPEFVMGDPLRVASSWFRWRKIDLRPFAAGSPIEADMVPTSSIAQGWHPRSGAID